MELKICPKKISAVLLGLMLWSCLASCVTMLPPMMTSENRKLPTDQWKKFGAFYEYDEMRILIDDFDTGSGFFTHYILNQKINILNRKGLQYGTFEIQKLGEIVARFDLQLISPQGKEVALNIAKIRQKYIDTGKVIVPKVEPGCQILLKIIFTKNRILDDYEHWFRKPIPVLKSRFSFFRPPDMHFQCKNYGTIGEPQQLNPGTRKGMVWNGMNMLPQDDTFENNWRFDLEPRVHLRLTKFHNQYFTYHAPGWELIAKRYRAYLLSPSLFTNRSKIKKLAEEITRGIEGEREQAAAILSYVQNEISNVEDGHINFEAINIHNVLEIKRGDRWSIALVLKEMLESLGFKVSVYVTRSRDWGGFDPEIPSWRQLYFPLVVTNIDGKPQIAYHYEANVGMGEYPINFFDNQAMNLEDGAIVPLPDPLYRHFKASFNATVSLNKWDSDHLWKLNYSQYAGMYIRKELINESNLRQRRYFEKMAKQYDAQNEVTHFQADGLNVRGDVQVTLKLKNKDFKIARPGAAQYSLAPWYSTHFEHYDPSMQTSYDSGLDVTFEENLLIKTPTGKTITVHHACLPLDNDLFSQECVNKKTPEGILLKRKIVLKKGKLGSDQLVAILPDIEKLNRIDESYVIEK